MGPLGLAVGPKAEVVHLLGLTHDLPSHLAPTRDHALALALDHDPILAHSPEAGAGPAPHTADRGLGHDLGPNRTPQGGGAGPALAAPLLRWSGSGGLGAKEQGIQDPIKGGDIRDKWDQYKGVGVALDDPYENYRRNKSYSFIARMKARDEC